MRNTLISLIIGAVVALGGYLFFAAANPGAGTPARATNPDAPEAGTDVDAGPKRQPLSGRWQLIDLQTVLASPAPADLQAGALTSALRETLTTAGLCRPSDETAPDAEQAQLGVELAWQRLNALGAPVELAAAATDGWLEVAALAQAEQRPEPGKKQGKLAERRATVRLPLPAAHWALPADYLAPRLGRLAEQVSADVLGQLWATTLADDALRPLLNEREVWRVTAALRELGERQQKGAAVEVHKRIGDSRKEVSVVALATAGRLAQPGALAAIRPLLEQPHDGEQLDAALVALADLRRGPEGAEAAAMLRLQADSGTLPIVRLRARQLLDQRVQEPTRR